jgi:hypothetical protein
MSARKRLAIGRDGATSSQSVPGAGSSCSYQHADAGPALPPKKNDKKGNASRVASRVTNRTEL